METATKPIESEVNKEVLMSTINKLLSEQGEFEEMEVLTILRDKIKVEDELQETKRELEKYKKHFGFCSKCEGPELQSNLNQYQWCKECNQINKDEYTNDWDEAEVIEVEEDDFCC